jgi:hypothetical protein
MAGSLLRRRWKLRSRWRGTSSQPSAVSSQLSAISEITRAAFGRPVLCPPFVRCKLPGAVAGLRSSRCSSRIPALALPARLPTNCRRRRFAPPWTVCPENRFQSGMKMVMRVLLSWAGRLKRPHFSRKGRARDGHRECDDSCGSQKTHPLAENARRVGQPFDSCPAIFYFLPKTSFRS